MTGVSAVGKVVKGRITLTAASADGRMVGYSKPVTKESNVVAEIAPTELGPMVIKKQPSMDRLPENIITADRLDMLMRAYENERAEQSKTSFSVIDGGQK